MLETEKITQWEKKLYKDFITRWEAYSSLGWKNRKGTDKTSIDWQVPAFAIRLVSDKAISWLKARFPEIHEEIRKMSVIMQYTKYRPKEAARLYFAKILQDAKYQARWVNFQRKRNGQKTLKVPTWETLNLKQKKEEFKNNYPKILIRKSNWEVYQYWVDFTGYLIALENYWFDDKQVVWVNYFFKKPAILKATNKREIEEKVFKRIKKILDRIETIINQFKYWSDDIYKSYKEEIIRLAKSLTVEWLDQELKRKEEKLQEQEVWKKVFFSWNKNLEKDLEVLDFDNIQIDNTSKVKKVSETKKMDLEWEEI